MAVGRNRREFDKTLRALRDAGRLEAIDASLVATVRCTADGLDRAEANRKVTPGSLGQLVRVHLEGLARLTGTNDADTDADPLTVALAGLGTPSVGDGSTT